MLVRLSRAPVVSIASIRGRATGVGSELALACDMRFASREKAILSHFEVGAGIVPGGGPMARLPRLMGRGRALEVFLGADDIPGDLAERYGYVNRSLPDAELDEFVDALANRIASFDKQAISETKRFVDVASLPPDYEIAPEWDVCLASIMRAGRAKEDQEVDGAGLSQAGRCRKPFGILRRPSRALSGLKKEEYQMSHHASGPNFGFPRGDARLDMTDLYAFIKPGDPNKSILDPQCASVFQVGFAGADNERALQTGSVVRIQDRHQWRCSCRSQLQCAVRIFRRREADCDSAPSSG